MQMIRKITGSSLSLTFPRKRSKRNNECWHSIKPPHDVVLDSAAGSYINPKSGHVVRFTGIGKNESAIKVPLQGYAGSTSDGLCNRVAGRIVEIVDWDLLF